jgi:glycosyltransferase involved in cell wall biosynthesis
MRILQISSARSIGGGERHFADLVHVLVRRGHEVYVALRPHSPLRAQLTSLQPRNILTLGLRNAVDLLSARQLARFIREHRIEIVHAHLARDYTLAAFAVRWAGSARLVLTRHVLFPLTRIHRLTLGNAARIIAVSHAVGDALRRQGIFDEAKISVVPNGIEWERFADRREAHRSGKLIGTISDFTATKGAEDFIRAASLVARRHRDVRFVIAGEDRSPGRENLARILRLIERLDLDGRISLSGWVEDIESWFAALTLFVSTSRYEAFSLAIVEAMASGVPVIATRSAGASEIITDGVSGCLVPIGDAEALAATIIELLDRVEEAERLSENARQIVQQKFSLERMVAETEAVYRQALAD